MCNKASNENKNSSCTPFVISAIVFSFAIIAATVFIFVLAFVKTGVSDNVLITAIVILGCIAITALVCFTILLCRAFKCKIKKYEMDNNLIAIEQLHNKSSDSEEK